MSIKHTFVSAIAEQSDATLVGPNEWNAIHTIDAGTITNAMLATTAASSLKGNSAGTAGPATDLSVTQVKTLLAIASTDVSGLATVATSGSGADLVAASVTNAKLATMATLTIKGNATAGAASPTDLTATQAKALLAIASTDVSGLAAIATTPSGANLTAATVTNAKLATMAANTIKANNTGSAAVPADITPSQLFDLVSATNGVLLTRTAGTWAALANIGTDNGDLVAAVNPAPVAPAAGVKMFATTSAGRPMLAELGPAGAATPLQPFIGRNKVGYWLPRAAAAPTIDSVGMQVPTITGTATARTAAATNLLTSIRRQAIVSAATAASVAGMAPNVFHFLRGSLAGQGGFHFITRFAISDASLVATANMFVGLKSSPFSTDVAPSTLTNLIGVGCDSGDTALQLYAAGAAAQTRTSLGASFPVNTVSTDFYELVLYAAPGAASVTYQVTRLNTGDTISGTISATANLPSTATFLGPVLGRSNGGTAAAVAFDHVSTYVETDY